MEILMGTGRLRVRVKVVLVPSLQGMQVSILRADGDEVEAEYTLRRMETTCFAHTWREVGLQQSVYLRAVQVSLTLCLDEAEVEVDLEGGEGADSDHHQYNGTNVFCVVLYKVGVWLGGWHSEDGRTSQTSVLNQSVPLFFPAAVVT